MANTSSVSPVPPDLDTNSGHAQSLYPTMLVTVVLFTILTAVSVAARLVTKRLVATLNIEDFLLMAAWMAGTAYNFLLLAAGTKGIGTHFRQILATQPSELPLAFKYVWVDEIIYMPAIWLAKASLLFQLQRVFTPMKAGPVYRACQALIWGNLMFYGAVAFAVIFECHPVSQAWDLKSEAHCINRDTVLIVAGGVNVFSDLLNLLLPVWAIWHLQMGLKRKVGVTALFATGLLAFVSSICRLVYATRLTPRSDLPYIIAQHGLCASAEIVSLILCTCLPMMPRLATLISQRYSDSRSRSHSQRKSLGVGNDSKWKNKQDQRSKVGNPSTYEEREEVDRLKYPYEYLEDEENGIKHMARPIDSRDTSTVGIALAHVGI